jgi:hypothetical protein
VKVTVRYEARCLQGCGWTPEGDPDTAARRHTGDGKLKNDGAKHPTVVMGVPCP